MVQQKCTWKFWVLLLVFVVLAVFFCCSICLKKRLYMPKIDPNVYQTVILEGAQQYFGHLHNIHTKYPYLSDIYYVKVQELNQADPEQSKFTLIKMGNELNGPEDTLYLNWNKVLFWENMKPDSKVVQGINREKAQRAAEKAAGAAGTLAAPKTLPAGTSTAK